MCRIPEIVDLLEARGHYSLSLVDRLHAKIYIAGDRCLAGSPNVTFAGLGGGNSDENIEVLVETTVDDPAVVATLDAVSKGRTASDTSTGSGSPPLGRLLGHFASGGPWS